MSEEARSESREGICVLTYTRLDVDEVVQSVASDEAGATAIFIGTTRNSFRGKMVTRLEYQAYSRLAMKTMEGIIHDAHQMAANAPEPTPSHHPSPSSSSSGIIRCAVHHRLGTVPVGEPSIVIAVSSPHRKESFLACEYILEQVKLRAQIWKKEVYEDGDGEMARSEWKANYDSYE